MNTRTINIALQEQTPKARTIKFLPDQTGETELLLNKVYSVTTNALGVASIALPVKDSGTIRYKAVIPSDKGTKTSIFYLSAGAAVDLGDLISAGGAATQTTLDYVDSRAVRFDAAQSLTTDQKTQARTNIGASAGGSLALDDLTDVAITGAASGEFLRHNGTNWVDAAIQAGDIPTGLDAAKIADGSVSNAELQHLNGVSSAIQTQLDAKQATLISATNIKTINGNSLLGAGDLSISGGGGLSNVVEDTTPQLGGNLDLNGFNVGAANAAALTKLSELTASSTELNYTDGVTSAIQTQLDGKASSSHNHDSAYQPLDSDLTAIAGLAPTNDDIVQRKAGAWTNRTPAQIKTDLALTKSDVGLSNVANSDTTTTANITDSTNKRFVTDANLTVIGNTSGTNSGNETATSIGSLINSATEKTTPADLDMVGLMDSAASNIWKKLSWVNIKATLKTYLDTLYQPLNSILTAFVGLSPSNDDFLQRKAGAWANRTIAQVKTDLGLTGTNSGDQTSIVGISGTLAEFNTAVSDANLASLAGAETLTNKTLTSPVINTPTADIVTSLTAETSIANDDVLMIYDASATALRKMTKANLVAGLGGGAATAIQTIAGTGSLTSQGDIGMVSSDDRVYVRGASATKEIFTAATGGSSANDLVGMNAANDGGEMKTPTNTATVSWDMATANQIKANVIDDSITYAKIQNVSATNRILGRITSGAGDVEELTAANLFTILGITASAAELNYTDGVTSAIQTQLDAKSPLEITQNSQSAAYTCVLSDSGKQIFHPSSDNNARTFTIPANSSVAYPVGTVLTFINMINTVTIAITTDTLILAGTGTTGSRTLAANGVATAIKITSTSWIISGNALT